MSFEWINIEDEKPKAGAVVLAYGDAAGDTGSSYKNIIAVVEIREEEDEWLGFACVQATEFYSVDFYIKYWRSLGIDVCKLEEKIGGRRLKITGVK